MDSKREGVKENNGRDWIDQSKIFTQQNTPRSPLECRVRN
jgi:hypothetical protein